MLSGSRRDVGLAASSGRGLAFDLVRDLVHNGHMAEVNVHEAKTHFSRLLQRVAAGEEIVIARAGQPVARLVPIERPARRIFGMDRGLFELPRDFDAPLPDEVQDAFEGDD